MIEGPLAKWQNDGLAWRMTRSTRPISWIKAARREFEKFPETVRSTCLAALTIAAKGGKADIAKPMHGMGSDRDCRAV